MRRGRRGGVRGRRRYASSSASRAAGFTPKTPVIEISGICVHCKAAPRHRNVQRAVRAPITPRRVRSTPWPSRSSCLLCLSWGFNQVAVKLAIHDIPPLMQGAIRSVGRGRCSSALWCELRGIPLFARDGTLWPGLAAGVAVRPRILLHLSGARLHHGDARGAVHLSRAVLRRARRARLPAGRSLQALAMDRACACPLPACWSRSACRRRRSIRARRSATS